MSKKTSKKTAREQVQAQMAAQARADARMKVVFRSLIGVVVLAVVAVVAAIGLNKGGGGDAEPTVMASGGISFASQNGVLTVDEDGASNDSAGITASNAPQTEQASDTPNVQVYLDFTCPHCTDFETANADYLEAAATNGDITLEYHPVSIMDGASRGTKWSSRAANAAVCVAEHDADAYLPVSAALFDAREAALAGHLDDRGLVELAQMHSDAGDELADCIRDGDYDTWIMDRTAEAIRNPDLVSHTGSFGTPTVVVNGKVYAGSWTDTAQLVAFIDAQRS